MALIQQVVQEIEQDEFAFEFDPERHDVHTVAGVLKVSLLRTGYKALLNFPDALQLYLRQLPEALLPIDSKEREIISSSSDEDAFKMLSKKLRKLPPSHQATAKMLVAHFARVLNHSAANKMSPQALALCLNPVLFTEETSLSAFAQGHKVNNAEETFSKQGLTRSIDIRRIDASSSLSRTAKNSSMACPFWTSSIALTGTRDSQKAAVQL